VKKLILLAALLLASCVKTPIDAPLLYKNNLEVYLANYGMEYLLVDNKCDDGKLFLLRFTKNGVNNSLQAYCLVEYNIIPKDYVAKNGTERIYLGYAKDIDTYFYIRNNQILDNKGNYITMQEAFGG
jgi:hypothetical protein